MQEKPKGDVKPVLQIQNVSVCREGKSFAMSFGGKRGRDKVNWIER